MARFRYAVLENDKGITAAQTSGTETIDLPENGILSNVCFQAKAAGSYTDNSPLPMNRVITKLELLVDGSTVVKSYNGQQCRALMWYSGGPFAQTNDYLQNSSSNYAYSIFNMYLGRTATDTKYGLDLGAYSNPQLKATWDTSQTSVDGVTWDNRTNPSFTYNVMAKVIDGRPPGFTNKYIQTRQIDSWTVAANTEHNTEIPRGYDLRGIMMSAPYITLGFQNTFAHVKLDFDNGKWLPIDMDYENLKAMFLDLFPKPCQKAWYWSTAHGDDFDMEMMYVAGSGVTPGSANGDVKRLPIIYWPINTVDSYSTDGTTHTTQSAASGISLGWGPNQSFYLPMRGLLDGSVESVKTTDFGRIDLKIKTDGSSGSAAKTYVVAEYEKPNGQ